MYRLSIGCAHRLCVFIVAMVSITSAARIHVSSDGSDASGDGSESLPFASLNAAVALLPSLPRTHGDSTEIVIRAGTYELQSTVTMSQTHGGTTSHPVIIRAVGEVTISGGTRITSPRVAGAFIEANVLVDTMRCLYVNGERGQRARTNERISGTAYVMNGTTRTGIVVDSMWLTRLSNTSGIDLHMPSDWRDAYVPVQSVSAGSMPGTWEIMSSFLQQVTSLSPVSAAPSFVKPFYVENAPELLDSPGEWYFDPALRIVRYIPRTGESISSIHMVVPRLERLLVLKGTSLDTKVLNVRIEGIRFAHTAWNLPQGRGWYGWQAGSLVRPSSAIPSAAIAIDNAEKIVLMNCIVENTAAIGLSMQNGVRHSRIEGNIFRDIADAAISISTPGHLFEDQAGEQVCAYDTISNNLIYKTGRDWYGAPALIAYYVTGLEILHNHIQCVPYSGISLGWGWNHDPSSTTCRENRVIGNRVVDFLRICRDGGGIYTLGRQPDSYVIGNYFKDGYNDYAGLYFDEGSAFFTAYDNIIENTPRWLHIWTPTINNIVLGTNYATTSAQTQNGTDITYAAPSLFPDANWPSTARAIIDTSGLALPYRSFLDVIPPPIANVSPSVRIRAPRHVSVGLADILVLRAAVADDGQPQEQPVVRWQQGVSDGTISFDRADIAGNVSLCFSSAGTYQVIVSADDGAARAADTISVAVADADKGTNWALGRPAAASSVWNDSVHPAMDAVDGDIGTIWHPAHLAFNDTWWTVDLEQQRSVARIELVSRQAYDQPDTRRNFMIQGANQPDYSDAVTFAVQGGIAFAYKGTWTHNSTAARAFRYIRYARAASGNSTIAELRVFSVTGQRVIPDDPVAVNIRHRALTLTRCAATRGGIIVSGAAAGAHVRVLDLRGRVIASKKIAARDNSSVMVPMNKAAHAWVYVMITGETLESNAAFGPILYGIR